MINITEATVLKIQNILENATVSASENVVEICQAIKYLKHLLKQHKDDIDGLEKALIRFFRIRPSSLNENNADIKAIYNILQGHGIIPSTPLTPEEKLLSEFSATYFDKYNTKSTDTASGIELETIEDKRTDQAIP